MAEEEEDEVAVVQAEVVQEAEGAVEVVQAGAIGMEDAIVLIEKVFTRTQTFLNTFLGGCNWGLVWRIIGLVFM